MLLGSHGALKQRKGTWTVCSRTVRSVGWSSSFRMQPARAGCTMPSRQGDWSKRAAAGKCCSPHEAPPRHAHRKGEGSGHGGGGKGTDLWRISALWYSALVVCPPWQRRGARVARAHAVPARRSAVQPLYTRRRSASHAQHPPNIEHLPGATAPMPAALSPRGVDAPAISAPAASSRSARRLRGIIMRARLRGLQVRGGKKGKPFAKRLPASARRVEGVSRHGGRRVGAPAGGVGGGGPGQRGEGAAAP